MAGIAAVMRDVTKQFQEMRALREQVAAKKAQVHF
jgi:signal transduction histidine kinase